MGAEKTNLVQHLSTKSNLLPTFSCTKFLTVVLSLYSEETTVDDAAPAPS